MVAAVENSRRMAHSGSASGWISNFKRKSIPWKLDFSFYSSRARLPAEFRWDPNLNWRGWRYGKFTPTAVLKILSSMLFAWINRDNVTCCFGGLSCSWRWRLDWDEKNIGLSFSAVELKIKFKRNLIEFTVRMLQYSMFPGVEWKPQQKLI